MAPKKTRRRAAPQPASDKAARLRAMYDHLVQLYGPQQWWPATTAFEVVIGAYLTQNTAWTSVERSLANLEDRGILNIDGLRAVPEDDLRTLIRPSGFMIRKAAALKAFVAFLDAQYAGSLDSLRHEAQRDPHGVRHRLLALPGIGPETADAVLLYALNAPAMVVDEYLRRITVRHGLVPEHAQYSAIQSLAEQAFAADRARDSPEALAQHYNEFHALIVLTGKTHCRRTAICDGCPLPGIPTSPTAGPEYNQGVSLTLYAATSNPGKLRDFSVAAAEEGIVIEPLPGLGAIPAPEETEPTFAGNARLKAAYYSRRAAEQGTPVLVLADDSGLEVDALHGEPGVRSARYAHDAGFITSDANLLASDTRLSIDARNNLYLLDRMRYVEQRSARYHCVLALARDGEILLTADGSVEGTILTAPRGSGGFGYDPLFYIPGLNRTMAEITLEEKHTFSHRGRALRALLPQLQALHL